MTIRTTLLTFSLIIPTTGALAHTGHMADTGAGHSHWLGYGLLALAVAIPACVALVRQLRKRASV